MPDYVVVVSRDVREELAYFVTAPSKAAARESYKNGEASLLDERRAEILAKYVSQVIEVPQLRPVLSWRATKGESVRGGSPPPRGLGRRRGKASRDGR
jgi:hypothetical protein